jgi:hypothetical protein
LNYERFYREVKLHLIEIGSIIGIVIVIYKAIHHEW